MSVYEIRSAPPVPPGSKRTLELWRADELLSTHSSLKTAVAAMDADARKRRPAKVAEIIDGVVKLMVRA